MMVSNMHSLYVYYFIQLVTFPVPRGTTANLSCVFESFLNVFGREQSLQILHKRQPQVLWSKMREDFTC